MGTLTNSEDQDEMLHNSLLRSKQSSGVVNDGK